MENYVSHDPSNPITLDDDVASNSTVEEINFDKDIDEIIKEIENDPDLQIDEDEIQQMLREIEEETANEQVEKPVIKIDES
jgi:CBS-domain-containing membrane protein